MHALIDKTGYMAIDLEPPSRAHTLAMLDESSESSLAICKCGARFLEVGPNHPAEARYSHSLHRYDAMMLAPMNQMSRAPIEPVRPTHAPIDLTTHYENGRKRRTAPGDASRIEQTAALIRLIEHDGLKPPAAARSIGINADVARRRLHEAGRGDLIMRRNARGELLPEIIRLMEEEGVTAAVAARTVGLTSATAYRWLQQVAEDAA